MSGGLRVAIAALVVLGAAGLLAVDTGPAEADTPDDPVVAALTGWSPVGEGGWVAGELTELDDTDACHSGQARNFMQDSGRDLSVYWFRCDTADDAAALVTAMWNDKGFALVPDSNAHLRGGSQLAGLYAGDPYIYHLWAQGLFFLEISRSCVLEQRATCEKATQAESESVADAVGLPVHDLEASGTDAADPILGWVPTGVGEWTRGEPSRIDQPGCSGQGVTLTATTGTQVGFDIVTCTDARSALALGRDFWPDAPDMQAELGYLFGPSLDEVTTTDVDGTPRVLRWWVQGTTLIALDRTCNRGDQDCLNANVRDAWSLGLWVPGEAVTDDTLASAGFMALVLIGVPVLTLLVLHVPRRLYARIRTSGYRTRSDSSAFVDVGALVRRTSIARTIRRVVIAFVVIATELVAIWFFPANNLLLFVLFGGTFLLVFVVWLILRLVWHPHPLITPAKARGRTSPAGVVGMGVRVVAVVFGAAALEVYVVLCVFFFSDLRAGGLEATSTLPTQGDPIVLLLNASRQLMLVLAQNGLIVLVFFGYLAIPLFLAYLLDRLGQRLTRRGLHDTLRTDERPYFLYLRGFDEDRLRVEESLGRRGFLELLSPFGRPRFEEVIVEHLSAYGPVIAISPRQRLLSDLGAAKVSLPNEEWRDRVVEWIAGARAVVISATPHEVREGLRWEIETLATREDAPPMMLVLAPWRRAEIARRWEGFLSTAARFPRFSPLVAHPMPDGLNIATYSAETGWRGYGARRRWDWSYAASIYTAVESGDL